MEEESLSDGETRGESGLPFNVVIKKLLKKERVDRVFKDGRKYVSDLMTFFFLLNHSPDLHIAIHTRKKLGIAVQRNRIKRVFRESVRELKGFMGGYDVVIVPRVSSKGVGSHQLTVHLKQVLLQTHILRE